MSHVCPWWFIGAFDNPLRRLIQNPDRIVEAWVKPGETAADIGCGFGYFTIPLARRVGPSGRVWAVDLQEQMLAGTRRRAERARVAGRIAFHRAKREGLGVSGPVDFVLTFWMVHEVPDRERFLKEIYELLRPGGKWLYVEPRLHVTGRAFEETVARALALGFSIVARPGIGFSRAVVFARGFSDSSDRP